METNDRVYSYNDIRFTNVINNKYVSIFYDETETNKKQKKYYAMFIDNIYICLVDNYRYEFIKSIVDACYIVRFFVYNLN